MLPLIDFKRISFEEANPWISGLKAGQDIFKQSIQNAYLSPQLQANLQQQQADATIKQAQAQYAPEMSLANLQNKQASTDLLGQQSKWYGPNAQSQISLRDAQEAVQRQEEALKKFFVKNPLLSKSGEAGQVGAVLYLQEHPELDPNRTNQGPIAGNVGGLPMTQPQMDTLGQVMNNPGQQQMLEPEDVLKNLLGKVGINSERTQPNVQQAYQQQQMPQQGIQQPPQQSLVQQILSGINIDQQQKKARTNYFNSAPGIRAATNPNLLSVAGSNKEVARGMAQTLLNQVAPGAKVTDDDIKNFQSYAKDAVLKKTKTGTQLNQMQYASNLDRLLDQGTELMPSVIKYAGLAGQFKKATDAIAAAQGAMPEDYSNYLNFTRVTVPQAAGEIGRTLGKTATIEETRNLKNVMNPTYWDSNPAMALKQWNWLVDSFKGRRGINQSLAASNADIRSQLADNQTLGQAASKSITKTINGKTYEQRNGDWYPL